MSNSYITLTNGTNRQTVERVVDGATVHACVDTLSDGINGSSIARVLGDNPLPTDPALVTRPINGSGTNALNIQDGGNSITVDGPLTDTQLRATAVPISGTVTANAGTGTFAVGGTVTANIGTIGTIATEATLSTLNGKVTAVDTGAVVLAAGTAAIGNLADKDETGTITALDGTVQIENPGGAGTWVLELTGTWVGTVSFERSISGAVGTWVAAGTPGGFTTAVANSTFRGEISGYRYFRARASAYTSGTIGVSLRLTPALLTLSLGTGANAIGKLAANSGVDIGDVDVTSVVPGTAATNLGKAEDGAHTSADVGVMALAVRKATPANLSDTDGDYEPLQVSAGRIWASAVIDTALPAGTANIGDVDVLTLPALAAGTNNIGKVNAGTSLPVSLWYPTTSIGVLVAATPRHVMQYTVPATRKAFPVRFSSNAATAGSDSRLTIIRKLGSYNLGTSTFTASGTYAAPAFGGRLFAVITTVVSATPTTLNVTYTDEAGNTGNTATVTIAASAAVDTRFYCALAGTDIGVMAVTAVTENPGTAATGVIDIYGEVVVGFHKNGASNAHHESLLNDLHYAEAADIVCLEIDAAATTAQNRQLNATLIVA